MKKKRPQKEKIARMCVRACAWEGGNVSACVCVSVFGCGCVCESGRERNTNERGGKRVRESERARERDWVSESERERVKVNGEYFPLLSILRFHMEMKKSPLTHISIFNHFSSPTFVRLSLKSFFSKSRVCWAAWLFLTCSFSFILYPFSCPFLFYVSLVSVSTIHVFRFIPPFCSSELNIFQLSFSFVLLTYLL